MLPNVRATKQQNSKTAKQQKNSRKYKKLLAIYWQSPKGLRITIKEIEYN